MDILYPSKRLYGEEKGTLEYQHKRYDHIKRGYIDQFGEGEFSFFSSPGRVEVCGNHTDHNHGKILAAAIDLDSVAAAGKNNSKRIALYSANFRQIFSIELDALSPNKVEEGSSNALIRGIAARFVELGYEIGGFNAYLSSEVFPGSGLSSSASFEVLIGTILNHFFNDGNVTPEEIARIGQYAENHFFGKPCGLMDQMTCALGGVVSIDFKDPRLPLIEKIDFDFSRIGYKLLMVDSGGDHASLTDEYAAVPKEMKSAAKEMGGAVLRDIDYHVFLKMIPEVRKKAGDRSVLRAYHFFKENKRVDSLVDAMKENDGNEILSQINKSGQSSFDWLQNIYIPDRPSSQNTTLTLMLTKEFFAENDYGACRIHGGGFAGTILVLLPGKEVDKYKKFMIHYLGENCITALKIRKSGAICLDEI